MRREGRKERERKKRWSVVVEAEEGRGEKEGRRMERWGFGRRVKREPDSFWNHQPRDLRFRRFSFFSIFLRIGQLKSNDRFWFVYFCLCSVGRSWRWPVVHLRGSNYFLLVSSAQLS